MKTIKILLAGLFAISFLNSHAQIKVDVNGNVGVKTDSPRGSFDVGSGNIWLSESGTSTGQSLYLPGHIYLIPYTSGISYLQARRSDNSGSTQLQLRTWNSGSLVDAMRINSLGYVGIGTTTPAAKLHVAHSDRMAIKLGGPSTSGGAVADLIFAPSNNVSVGGAKYWNWSFRTDAWSSSTGDFVLYSHNGSSYTSPVIFQADGDIIFASGNGAARNGNVAIGKLNPTCKLDVEGVIKTNGMTVTSDARFKENIMDLSSNISSIQQLRPVSYTMKKNEKPAMKREMMTMSMEEKYSADISMLEDSAGLATLKRAEIVEPQKARTPKLEDDYFERNRMGFLAQDMEKVFPQLVYTDENGYKSIDYISLIPVLVSAIQEQQAEIDALKAKLEEQGNGQTRAND